MTSIPNTSHPSWSFLRLRDRCIPIRSWFRLDLITWPRNYEMLIHVVNGIKVALQWRLAIALISFVYVRNLLYFVMCKYPHFKKLHLGFPGLFEVKCLEVVTILLILTISLRFSVYSWFYWFEVLVTGFTFHCRSSIGKVSRILTAWCGTATRAGGTQHGCQNPASSCGGIVVGVTCKYFFLFFASTLEITSGFILHLHI